MQRAIGMLAMALLSLTMTPRAKADVLCDFQGNLVKNCSFEEGFTNWYGTTTTDNHNGIDGFGPAYGNGGEVYLGSYGIDTLSQMLDTVPGQEYMIAFTLLNYTDSPPVFYPNSFTVTFGGDTVFTYPAGRTGLTWYGASAIASGPHTELSFNSRNAGGYFFLDSVSVDPTPEPGSLLLLGTGIASLAAMARRRLT